MHRLPEPEASIKEVKNDGTIHHEDMVTAVSGSETRFILTGSSDKIGRLWRDDWKCSHILEGHKEGITSVTYFCPEGVEIDSSLYVATASKDNTLMFWECDVGESYLNKKINCIRVLDAHTASVNSIVTNPSRNKLCSGSCDSKIKIWKTRRSSKMGELEVDAVVPDFQREGVITSVVWPEENFVYSASMDKSIYKWDIENKAHVWNVPSLIASGAVDNILRIWDTRKPGKEPPINSISYHTSWIAACKWHKDSHHLLSASYDKSVMLWDMRTTKSPMAIIKSHKHPVLAVDWWKDSWTVSGGSNCSVHISDVSSILQ